jgi:hypothetical protein
MGLSPKRVIYAAFYSGAEQCPEHSNLRKCLIVRPICDPAAAA